MSPEGTGVGRINNKIVFVPRSFPGDQVQVSITKEEKNYYLGEISKLLTLSNDRISSNCPTSITCGGCCYRSLPLQVENDYKTKTVNGCFQKKKLSASVNPVVACSDGRYRNKAVFRYTEEGQLAFHEEGTHSLTACADCQLVPEAFLNIGTCIAKAIKTQEIHYLYLRQSTEHAITLILSTKHNLNVETLKNLEITLQEQFPSITGFFVSRSLHPEDADATFTKIFGTPYLTDELQGLTLRTSFQAFRQVNFEGIECLLKEVMRLAKKANPQNIVDLYCGAGLFGLYLAQKMPNAKVTGIEINPFSVKDAKENAKRNSLTNIRFFTGNAATVTEHEEHPDLIVIDPPRAGCSPKMIAELLSLKPASLIYVSCNPLTLTDNLVKLSSDYTIEEVQPFNLFPRTKHVETIVLLTRKQTL